MDNDYESPFLDRDTPRYEPEDEYTSPSIGDNESPFTSPFLQGESPFLSGEAPDEGEADEERQADPSLFDPAELEHEQGRWGIEAADETEAMSLEAQAPGAALFGQSEREGAINGNGHYAGETSNGHGGYGEQEAFGAPEGEIIILRQEAESPDEGEGYGVFDGEGVEAEEEDEQRPTPGGSRVLGRILWPALGFPSVIAPKEGSREGASVRRSVTRCITALVLTDRPELSKAEAARYLRIVPWKDIGRRHIPMGKPGSFREEDLIVRNDVRNRQLSIPTPEGKHDRLVKFGEDEGGFGIIVGTLSEDVRALYRKFGLKYLHEIRISEEVSARLDPGRYHLFWNNESTKEDAPSDEMAFLLECFAKPRRQQEGTRWAKVLTNFLREYEYEYGPTHFPYSKEGRPVRRAELLHPVFVRRETAEPLRISHVTDLHVDVRSDVYEFNLQKNPPAVTPKPVFNNWNTSVAKVYTEAKDNADVLLLTGDLVDYGRGHIGVAGYKHLADNGMYHRDRNWFLFYDIIATGDRYTVPAYTSLGNHDWRLNPYPPFALAGAPSVPTLLHNYTAYDDGDRKKILKAAHGDGHDALISYDPEWKTIDLATIASLVPLAGRSVGTLDRKGLPTETKVDSVIWYLLQINPFLDYLWSMPSGHRMLMLDWAENEAVLFPIVKLGKEFTLKLSKSDFVQASDPGPKALDSLSASQKWLVQQLVDDKSKAKIIGIHQPPLGPYPEWSDGELASGNAHYASRSDARGPMNYAVKKNGTVTPLNGHPIFAVQPPGDAAGMVADYGSFLRERDWLIRLLARPESGVRAVLSGHNHRNNLLGVRIPVKAEGKAIAGQYLVRAVEPNDVIGMNGPALAPAKGGVRAPLYLNTTSAGPRGNFYQSGKPKVNVDPGYSRLAIAANGTITDVRFCVPGKVSAPARPAPARVTREAFAWR